MDSQHPSGPATEDEVRRLQAAHAVGFFDTTLTSLRYDDLVEEDRASLLRVPRRREPSERDRAR